MTVIAAALGTDEEIQEIADREEEQTGLFTETKVVTTDPDTAGLFFQRLSGVISKLVLMDIVYCFLSEEKGIEKTLLGFVRLLLTKGEGAASNYSDPNVLKVRRLSDKVSHEIERLHGFIRFRKLRSGVFYAVVEPDYNIIQFLAPHFTARFADQAWLIHDRKRGTGIYYDGNNCRFLPSLSVLPELISASSPYSPDSKQQASDLFDEQESRYQEIWNLYFQEIAIAERKNERAQKQRMPVRYWRYLVEKIE